MQNIYRLTQSSRPLPLVFDSPHSGRFYPPDFKFSCPFDILEKAEDNYVDDLFSSVPDYGGTLLCALFPRTYIDVNRAIDDIDPALLEDNFESEYTINPTSRSHAGIGLIRRIVRPGVPVYHKKLTLRDIQHRIESCYRPYHQALHNALHEKYYNFGQVWHLNCHSMPQNHNNAHQNSAVTRTPDFVLGDRNGTSCSLDFTHFIRDTLTQAGYHVAINNPYRGLELIQRYADPAKNRHSLQIEINKGLYWNEDQNQPTKHYQPFKKNIEQLIQHCAQYVASHLDVMAAD